MRCPNCREPLIAIEYDEIEVDYCVQCQGVWLDAGELELLFEDRAITQGFLNAGTPAHGKNRRKCPICERAMTLQTTGGAAPVTYDACSRGHGLWFDRGELALVLEHGSDAAGGAAVRHWLRDLFRAEGH